MTTGETRPAVHYFIPRQGCVRFWHLLSPWKSSLTLLSSLRVRTKIYSLSKAFSPAGIESSRGRKKSFSENAQTAFFQKDQKDFSASDKAKKGKVGLLCDLHTWFPCNLTIWRSKSQNTSSKMPTSPLNFRDHPSHWSNFGWEERKLAHSSSFPVSHYLISLSFTLTSLSSLAFPLSHFTLLSRFLTLSLHSPLSLAFSLSLSHSLACFRDSSSRHSIKIESFPYFGVSSKYLRGMSVLYFRISAEQSSESRWRIPFGSESPLRRKWSSDAAFHGWLKWSSREANDWIWWRK